MTDQSNQQEIILYQSGGSNVPVSVRYMDETFWLTQAEMAGLFDVDVRTISHHITNIFDEGELEKTSSTTSSNNIGRTKTTGRPATLYNLDVIIAAGYKVNSKQATKFRQWATATLKEYITKGFVLNDDMLKNGRPFGKDYFDELLVRIRDIRASERRVYQKIADIFQECSFDYDKKSNTAHDFYASLQNKLHFAVTGDTAAELIFRRADASLPNMGLTTWKGSPNGPIHSSDITVAKNYLFEYEMSELNRLVTMFLDDVELRASDHQLMSMQDCSDALDNFLAYHRREVLNGKGSRSSDQAKKKAKDEFGKFRKIQDKNYESDFDMFVKRISKKSNEPQEL